MGYIEDHHEDEMYDEYLKKQSAKKKVKEKQRGIKIIVVKRNKK